MTSDARCRQTPRARMLSLAVLAACIPAALTAQAPKFAPAAITPLSSSTNYTGASNGTLAKQDVVPGKVFDRFIQVTTIFRWVFRTDRGRRFGSRTPTSTMLLRRLLSPLSKSRAFSSRSSTPSPTRPSRTTLRQSAATSGLWPMTISTISRQSQHSFLTMIEYSN